MKSIDYEELDDAICAFLIKNDSHPTISQNLCNIAQRFTDGVSWRLIDRRLQEMRKSGRIKFIGRRKNNTSQKGHGWLVQDKFFI